MPSPDSSDRSLLDRLNALKPTSISLDTKTTHGLASTAAPGASAFTDAGPTSVEKKQPPLLSREDALAERLRVLRNSSQPDQNKPPNSNLPASSCSGTQAQPQCPATHLANEIPNEQPWQKSSSSIEPSKTENSNDRSIYEAENLENVENDDDYIHLLESGADPDQTLDELLDELDEDFDIDNDPPSLPEFDPAKEAKKVSDLLELLQKENKRKFSGGAGGIVSTKQHDGDAVTVPGKVSGEQPPRAPQSGGPDDNDDDSESEHMTREVEDVLSRIREELDVGSEDKAGETGGDGSAAPGSEFNPAPAATLTPSQDEGRPEPFSLSDALASPLRDITPSGQEEMQQGEGSRRKSTDFENDIVARMASLKGLGSGINVDAFGLPVAPTFSPQDHQSPKDKKGATKGGVGRAGYTDEDQKTWCIVCLDDATIKCIGCDSDVFCARCWRDMHVGPSAGYDERGHQWVKFVRSGG